MDVTPTASITTEGVSGSPWRSEVRARDEDEIQEKQEADADQAQFFTDDGKDEVRVVFRQEVQLALGPLEEALAKEHARTDGDFDWMMW